MLSSDQPAVAVLEPTADTVAVIGQEQVVAFAAYNGSGQVDIALQREQDGAWEDLATTVDAAAGLWSWDGDGRARALRAIRVADTADPAVAGTERRSS